MCIRDRPGALRGGQRAGRHEPDRPRSADAPPPTQPSCLATARRGDPQGDPEGSGGCLLYTSLPLPPPVEESLYGFDDVELERRNVGLLPDNLKDAISALEADEVVLDALGDTLSERFLEVKALEWKEYRTQVTPWEQEQYLERA